MKTEISKQVFHPYDLWEDHKHGFYNNISGSNKMQMILDVVTLFSNPTETNLYMNRVVKEWKFSCEHNFTNPSMNRVAYLGQAACALYKGIPSTVTMECWSLLSKEVQDRSNKIAKEIIKEWIDNNKNIQLCLNIY